MKTIKVKNVKTQEVSYYNNDINLGTKGTTLVAEGKLVLVKAQEDALLAFNQYNGEYYILPKKGDRLRMPASYLKPIIISETEETEVGDWFYSKEFNTIDQLASNGVIDKNKCFKILVLPEQFSPKHLLAIVEGKMKEGSSVLVECENGPIYSDNSEGKQAIVNKESEWKDYRIKLNFSNYVTLHKKEEKVYTIDLLRAAYYAGMKQPKGMYADWKSFEEWIERNDK